MVLGYSNESAHKNKSQGGFTLVELSVVMAIIALVATFGLDMAGTYMQRTAHNTTNEKLDEIQLRIEDFIASKGRLPCPADPALSYTSANFGAEACGGGSVVSIGSAYIGALPIRALHLPLDYIGDSWEQKFTYAVTTALTTSAASYSTTPTGNLRITGGNLDSGTSYYDLTSSPSIASYVVLSHGRDGKGAYGLRTNRTIKDCVPLATSLHDEMIDVENCDRNDVWFFEAAYNDGDVEARYFDDIVRWGVK